jgi:hypothetical protein
MSPEVVYLPFGVVKDATCPSPACCSVPSEQLHWPFVSTQLATFQPAAEKMFAARSHATATDETERQLGASGNVTEPVVVVLSVYVPSSFATNVPVVVREPLTGTVAQPKLRSDTSMSPDNFRHEDATVHDPTMLPPQGVTPAQLSAAPEPPLPPVFATPPVALDPPEVEACPAEPPGF